MLILNLHMESIKAEQFFSHCNIEFTITHEYIQSNNIHGISSTIAKCYSMGQSQMFCIAFEYDSHASKSTCCHSRLNYSSHNNFNDTHTFRVSLASFMLATLNFNTVGFSKSANEVRNNMVAQVEAVGSNDPQ